MKTHKIIGTIMLLAGAGTMAYMYYQRKPMSHEQQLSSERNFAIASGIGLVGLIIVLPKVF